MNKTLKKILKFLSRSLGFFLINFSVLLILFMFFLNSSINNIDTLKNDLQDSIKEEILIQVNANDNLREIVKYCNNNSDDGRCKELSEINSQINNNKEINDIFNTVKLAKDYIKISAIASLILFLIGFVLVYLGVFNFLETSYKVSVHLAIHNFLAALYFKFIPNLFNFALNTSKIRELTQNIPQEYIQKISSIILNWLKTPLSTTIKLTVILGVIFLVISIILYLLKKKALKDKNKDK